MDLSKKSSDPDGLIGSLIQEKFQLFQNECVIHSTSWRYTSPGRVVLTYIAYSDELDFGTSTVKNLTLKE